MRLRQPTLFWATCGAAGLLALAAAAVPSAQTTATSIAFVDSTADVCPALLGSRVHTSESFGDPPRDDPEVRAYYAAKHEVEATAARRAPGLQQATRTFYGHSLGLQVDAEHSSQQTTVNVVFRDGYTEHVEPVSGPSGIGIWMPDSVATSLGIAVGDSVTLLPADLPPGFTYAVPLPDNPEEYVEYGGENPLPPSTLQVSAIYADLSDPSRSGFWCGVPSLLANPTLPMVLLDEALLDGDDLGFLLLNPSDGDDQWDNLALERRPADANPTLAEARDLTRGIAAMHLEMATAELAPEAPQTYFPSLDASPSAYESGVAEVVADAEAAEAEMRPTVIAIVVAGLAVGVAAVIAVGVFWARRRRSALIERAGAPMSAIALGRRAAAEAVIPVAAGALGGWVVAEGVLLWMLSSIPGSALTSLLTPAAGMVAALLLFALGAGLAGSSLALDDEFLPRKDLRPS